MVPDHLPARMRAFRDQYEHHMIILASDQSIQETQNLLEKNWKTGSDHAYFECSESEGKAALLHRYVAGNAPARYQILNQDNSGELLPLDIALPRNC